MRKLLVAMLWCSPLAAFGQTGLQTVTCHFTTECVDTEACGDSAYEMTVRYVPDLNTFVPANPKEVPPDPFTVEVSDDAGTFKAAPLTNGGFGAPLDGFVSFNGEATQRLFTLSGAKSRYSVHMRDADTAIYYEGTCEEAAS